MSGRLEMLRDDRPSRIRLGAAAATLLALLLAACSAAAPSSTPTPTPSASASVAPSPSASPSPSPSPSPDVSGLFIANLKAMSKASMTITGTLAVLGVSVGIDGRYDVRGSDHYSTMTMSIGDQKQTTESTTWAGRAYERTGDTPWYEDPASNASPAPGTAGDLGAFMTSLLSVKDAGVETKAGQQLHRLSPGTGTLEPRAIGMDGTGTVKLDFFAKDDGTPVLMELTVDVTQVTATAKAPTRMTGTMDFTFVPGADPVISAPDPVFETFTSKKGFSFGHPTGWDAYTEKIWEGFSGPNGEEVGVAVEPLAGRTLTSLAAGQVLSIKTDLKGKVASNVAGTLGGEQARVITYTFADSGVDYVGTDVLTLRGGSALLLQWLSPAGNETADGKTFGYMVGSFKFTK